MNEREDVDPEYGIVDGVYLTRAELYSIIPSVESMVDEMGIRVGDVIEDEEDGLCHVVTNVGMISPGGGLLLDCPSVSNYDELYENGIATALVDYYAKWRRGTLRFRCHWPNWTSWQGEQEPDDE